MIKKTTLKKTLPLVEKVNTKKSVPLIEKPIVEITTLEKSPIAQSPSPITNPSFIDSIKLFFNNHPRIAKLVETIRYLLILFAGFKLIKKTLQYFRIGMLLYVAFSGFLLYFFNISLEELTKGWGRLGSACVIGINTALVMIQNYLSEIFVKTPSPTPSVPVEVTPTSNQIPSFVISKERMLYNLKKQYPNLTVEQIDKLVDLLTDAERKKESISTHPSIRKEYLNSTLPEKGKSWLYYPIDHPIYSILFVVTSLGVIYYIGNYGFDLTVISTGISGFVTRISSLWNGSQPKPDEDPINLLDKRKGKLPETGSASSSSQSSYNSQEETSASHVSKGLHVRNSTGSSSGISETDSTEDDWFVGKKNYKIPPANTFITESETLQLRDHGVNIFKDLENIEKQIRVNKEINAPTRELLSHKAHLEQRLNQINDLIGYNKELNPSFKVSVTTESPSSSGSSTPKESSSFTQDSNPHLPPKLTPILTNSSSSAIIPSLESSIVEDSKRFYSPGGAPLPGNTNLDIEIYQKSKLTSNLAKLALNQNPSDSQAQMDYERSKAHMDRIEKFYNDIGFKVQCIESGQNISISIIRKNPLSDETCVVNQGVFAYLLSYFNSKKNNSDKESVKTMQIYSPTRFTILSSNEICKHDLSDMEILSNMHSSEIVDKISYKELLYFEQLFYLRDGEIPKNVLKAINYHKNGDFPFNPFHIEIKPNKYILKVFI
jgi:hypothetical protein